MGKGERERERLRQERIEAEQRDSRSGNNRLIVTYAIVSTVVLAVAVLVFILVSGGGGGGDSESASAHINGNQAMGSTNGVEPDERAGIVPARTKVFDLHQAAKEAGCVLELKLKDEGHNHLPHNSPEPNYETNPPTSGNHVEPPYQQADGAYSEEPKALDYVHSLEHGRMEIQYSPDLPEKAQLELKGLYDTMYGATLLFPNSKMPYDVAATTWTNLIGCKTYKGAITLDAIRAFGRETWGKYGGEPVEGFTFTGPTPAKPEEPSE
ncbi:MAG TPA: DUF3105 domain-containing protein [Solirubrobacterales bacterium]|jgi:hypothetical protein|nr:DUF3105 domain-containing protein [Solirubrobacterales bacterium]